MSGRLHSLVLAAAAFTATGCYGTTGYAVEADYAGGYYDGYYGPNYGVGLSYYGGYPYYLDSYYRYPYYRYPYYRYPSYRYPYYRHYSYPYSSYRYPSYRGYHRGSPGFRGGVQVTPRGAPGRVYSGPHGRVRR